MQKTVEFGRLAGDEDLAEPKAETKVKTHPHRQSRPAQDEEFWMEVKRRTPPDSKLGTPIYYRFGRIMGHRRPSDGKAEFFHPWWAYQQDGELAPYPEEIHAEPKPAPKPEPEGPKKQPADVRHKQEPHALPEGVDTDQALPDDLAEIPLTLQGQNQVAFANDIDQALYGFLYGPQEQRADFKEWLEHIGFPVTPVTVGRMRIAKTQIVGLDKKAGYKGTVTFNPVYDAPTRPATKEADRDATRAESARVPEVEAPRRVQEDAQDAGDRPGDGEADERAGRVREAPGEGVPGSAQKGDGETR